LKFIFDLPPVEAAFFGFRETGSVMGTTSGHGPELQDRKVIWDMSHVLVVFQADMERTEQLALAVGVGAVEAEAAIRLRRLRMPGAVEVGHKGYGTLREADLLWADSVVVGLERERSGTEELNGLVAVLSGLDPSQMQGKEYWTFNAEGTASRKTEAQTFAEEALLAAGITPVQALVTDAAEEMERMKGAGRQLGRQRT
jgi:hypothetical protein